MKKTISINCSSCCLAFLPAACSSLRWAARLGDEPQSAKLVAYIDTELSAERHLRDLYAQGLQMGQAIRNILLDPANPKAYQNHDKAQQDFDAALDGLAALELEGEQGRKLLMDLRAGQAARQPLRHGVIEAVRAATWSRREALVARETPAWRSVKQVMLDGLVAARQQTVDTRQRCSSSCTGQDLALAAWRAGAGGGADDDPPDAAPARRSSAANPPMPSKWPAGSRPGSSTSRCVSMAIGQTACLARWR